MSDKERVEAIMSHYHLNNVAFCNKVGLNQATLSNILGGRTNPSLPVLRNIIDAFPEISPNWMFMGIGEMMKSDDATVSPSSPGATPLTGDLFSTSSDSNPDDMFSPLASMSAPSSGSSTSRPLAERKPVAPAINVNDIVTGVVSQLQKPQRKIVEVRIFFDDGTFETFSSR